MLKRQTRTEQFGLRPKEFEEAYDLQGNRQEGLSTPEGLVLKIGWDWSARQRMGAELLLTPVHGVRIIGRNAADFAAGIVLTGRLRQRIFERIGH